MSGIRRLIPHLFTAGNLVGGIFAIILTIKGYVHLAPFAIFASAILDFLDGFVARLLGVPSELGKQLDSLADMVTFGVAPGLIVYQLLKTIPALESFMFIRSITGRSGELFPNKYDVLCTMEETPFTSYCTSPEYILLPFVGLIIPVFAMFRLAKFNLDTRQTNSFIGLPTPAMTIFIAALPLMIYLGLSEKGFFYDLTTEVLLNKWFLIGSSVILSILMVVPLPLFSLKFKSFGWKGNEIRYIFLTISVGLLATLFVWALPLIIILYLLLSVLNNVLNKPENEIQSGN